MGTAPTNVVVMAGSAGALPIILAQLNRLTFTSSSAVFVAYHRVHPNLDVLLGSLAARYGAGVTAVLLSGMARDGLAGLEAVRRATLGLHALVDQALAA